MHKNSVRNAILIDWATEVPLSHTNNGVDEERNHIKGEGENIRNKHEAAKGKVFDCERSRTES